MSINIVGNYNKLIMSFYKLIMLMALLGISLSFSGCAHGMENCNKYAGTNKEFECRANQGDRSAQYSLGVSALEMGQMDVALKWLKKAAEPEPTTQSVYMPPVGNGSGRVLLIPKNGSNPGYRPAQTMLYRHYMLGLGVERDEKKANWYKELAAVPR